MKINLPLYDNVHDGFGTAGRNVRNSLIRLGHDVSEKRDIHPDADVTISFAHPEGFYSTDGFDIGYFPFESTAPKPGWKKRMSIMDEVWVTSPWMRDVVRDWGYETHVYEHGVNPLFTHSERRKGPSDGPLKFLYMGPESYRKGSYEAVHAFRKAFGWSMDYELVIKTQAKDMPKLFPNIRYIEGDIGVNELAELFYECDVFICPTYGEGFGLPARDAMTSGMPLIATGGFLPYEGYMHSDLIIPSTLIDSPWPDIHPGQVYRPDVDEFTEQLRLIANDYDKYLTHAVDLAPTVSKVYDWDTITHKVISSLESRL